MRGDGRGRTIGVPTANVSVDDKIAMPSNGVYAVYFLVDGKRWAGAANLGVRPTFDKTHRSLEIHLLDFTGDLYGRWVEVEFRPSAASGGTLFGCCRAGCSDRSRHPDSARDAGMIFVGWAISQR